MVVGSEREYQTQSNRPARLAGASRIACLVIAVITTAGLLPPPPCHAAVTFDFQWDNQTPQGNNLNAVSLPSDPSSAATVAVGARGTRMVSTDSGSTWDVETAYLGVVESFTGIHRDLDKEMVVGDDGTALLIEGSVATPLSLPTTKDLNDIFLFARPRPSSRDTWGAVGDSGLVLKSTDCGTTWLDISIPGITEDFLTGAGTDLSDSTAWHVMTVTGESGAIYHTDNCGANWVNVAAAGVDLRDLGFSDQNPDLGLAAGDDGTILRTTDGGLNWAGQNSGTSTRLNGVSQVGPTDWAAVGALGMALTSFDDGVTWEVRSTGTTETLNAVAGADGQVVAVGNHGTIVQSFDAGATFELLSGGFTHGVTVAVSFADSEVGLAFGSFGEVARSTDGGVVWEAIDAAIVAAMQDAVFDPGTPAAAWYVGNSGRVFKTTDQGVTWVQQTSGTTRTLRAVTAPAADVVFAAGDNGTVIHTSDGGQTWTSRAPAGSTGWRDIFAIDPTDVWVVGTGGTIAHSTDGGLAWSLDQLGPTVALQGVHWLDSSTGVTVGSSGAIFTTVDGGANWVERSSSEPVTFTEVMMLDGNTAVAVSAGDMTVWTTVDGGQTWEGEAIGAGSLFGIGLRLGPERRGSPGDVEVFVAGVDGSILSSMVSEPTDVESPPSAADHVRLSQNQPNPVTGTTTIRYALNQAGPVTVALFDAAGRKVATLFDGNQDAGWHGLEADLSSLANGIYLYRLGTHEGSVTRRLTVLR